MRRQAGLNATAGQGHLNTAFGDVDEQIQLGTLRTKIARSGAGIMMDSLLRYAVGRVGNLSVAFVPFEMVGNSHSKSFSSTP